MSYEYYLTVTEWGQYPKGARKSNSNTERTARSHEHKMSIILRLQATTNIAAVAVTSMAVTIAGINHDTNQ